jgi:murein DD-endopeptidase MepM/ murein hydrolase activator NlpD
MNRPIFKLFLTSILLPTLAGCQLPSFNNNSGPEANQPTACTMEAKLCPNGTSVGRRGPNCEFAPCPVQPQAQTETAEPKNNDKITGLQAPIKDFQKRITKKFFGTYITPDSSPVQPERFTGYHTGVDVEYEDMAGNVPVLAIANGTVKYSAWTSGYGGAMAISHITNGESILAIYGHLNPDSMVKKGETVKAGQQIGILGQGYTQQTDNERKHLHFALYKGTDINLRGYVANKELLEQWLDPLTVVPLK